MLQQQQQKMVEAAAATAVAGQQQYCGWPRQLITFRTGAVRCLRAIERRHTSSDVLSAESQLQSSGNNHRTETNAHSFLHDTRSHCGCVQDEVSSENTNIKQADR